MSSTWSPPMNLKQNGFLYHCRRAPHLDITLSREICIPVEATRRASPARSKAEANPREPRRSSSSRAAGMETLAAVQEALWCVQEFGTYLSLRSVSLTPSKDQSVRSRSSAKPSSSSMTRRQHSISWRRDLLFIPRDLGWFLPAKCTLLRTNRPSPV